MLSDLVSLWVTMKGFEYRVGEVFGFEIGF